MHYYLAKRVLLKYRAFCRDGIFPSIIYTLICSSYNRIVNVPSPSMSLSLSHSLCAALPLIGVSVPAPSLQAGGVDKIFVRKWLESLKKKALGEGKCSDKHKSLIYIAIMHAFPCSWKMPLHLHTHSHTYEHSMLKMTLIQLGPAKKSDLSA